MRSPAGKTARPHSTACSCLFFGSASGAPTFDRDDSGGNPFATSLIELAADPGTTLRNLPARLRRATAARTQRAQIPEAVVPAKCPPWHWALGAGSRGESRAALVLVVSHYPSLSVPILRGAALDERRISAMLAGHGFSVTQGVAPDRQSILVALRTFARASQRYDTAVIYSTGHGVESAGEVFLIPGDYPVEAGFRPGRLRTRAVSVASMVDACRGTKVNLTFFAGCRTLVPA